MEDVDVPEAGNHHWEGPVQGEEELCVANSSQAYQASSYNRPANINKMLEELGMTKELFLLLYCILFFEGTTQ